MTITYSLDHVETTTESVDVEVAAKDELVLVSTDADPKTGEITSTYVLASGDDAFPSTVAFRSGLQNRQGNQVRRLSVTFSTWAVRSDSVTGLDTRRPIQGTISFLVPSGMTIEIADFDQLLGNLFSFMYASVTTGTRDTDWLQRLLYGAPQVQ
jgi:hypothetical protein